MPYIKKNYDAILKNILEKMLHPDIRETNIFKTNQKRYDLKHKSSHSIQLIRVEGWYEGHFYFFEKDIDYIFQNEYIEWTYEGKKPDHDSSFTMVVNDPAYTSKLTDFSPGSVISIIAGSISKEIEILYEQLDIVYGAGFIDTAYGSSLDKVVKLLGVSRNQSTKAIGEIVFSRSDNPPEITIKESFEFHLSKLIYEITEKPVNKVICVNGFQNGNFKQFMENLHFSIDDKSYIRWISKDDIPTDGSIFEIEFVSFEKFLIPKDTIVETRDRYHGKKIQFRTTREASLKFESGKFRATVPIECISNGKIGNLPPYSITSMPTPPIGVNIVTNFIQTDGGSDQESDESLRRRTTGILELHGKATMDSLKNALSKVDGIISEPIIIEMPESVPGIVQVIVDGGDIGEILQVIDETRAAGIMIEVIRPTIVTIDVELDLSIDKKDVFQYLSKKNQLSNKDLQDNLLLKEGIEFLVSNSLYNYFSKLKIGIPVIMNHLKMQILNIPGIIDIERLQYAVNRRKKIDVFDTTFKNKITRDVETKSPILVEKAEKVILENFEKAELGFLKINIMEDKLS